MIILLILFPAARSSFIGTPAVGGGGEGPAGGGGGGAAGGGSQSVERLQYIQLNAPRADAVKEAALPPVLIEKPVPRPEPTPPPAPVVSPAPPTSAPTAASSGVGGVGTGTAGSGGAGAGPGSGGGIGSGTGTGTGTGAGSGTGGGAGTNYPPTPTQFFLPPLPAPSSIRGYHLTAYFDVDEKGNAKLLGFNPSNDGSYNRKLRAVLTALKFRPGTRPDGTPVRDTVDIQFIF